MPTEPHGGPIGQAADQKADSRRALQWMPDWLQQDGYVEK